MQYYTFFMLGFDFFSEDKGAEDLSVTYMDTQILGALEIAKSVLAIYLFHVSFYSATNACWDRVGFWIHLIAATFVFLLLPAAIISIVVIDFDKSQKTAYAQLYLILGISNFLVMINAIIFVRKGLYDTYQWYKIRHQKENSNNAIRDMMSKSQKADEQIVPYKNVIPGNGGGKIKLGTEFELSENLYSLLFVSLIRKEYVDACEEEEEKGDEAKKEETFKAVEVS